jgi:hypothetical protein
MDLGPKHILYSGKPLSVTTNQAFSINDPMLPGEKMTPEKGMEF